MRAAGISCPSSPSFLIVTGGSVFTPLGKVYQRVCVLTAPEDALDDGVQKSLRLIYGIDPLNEAVDQSSTQSAAILPWWVLGAPLKTACDDSIAVSSLERHLRKRRSILPKTSLPSTSNTVNSNNSQHVLIYETDPSIKVEETQEDPLGKSKFIEYLAAWSDIVYIGYDLESEAVDLTERFCAKTRPSPATAANNNDDVFFVSPPPGVAPTAGGALNRHSSGDQAAENVENEDLGHDNDVSSLLTTELIEGIDDYGEEIEGPMEAAGVGHAGAFGADAHENDFNRSHPRRSNRIFILDSIHKKKDPVPPLTEVNQRKKRPPQQKQQKRLSGPAAGGLANNNNNDNTKDDEAGPRKRARDKPQQHPKFNTRPVPKKPVQVICGEAKGLWNPQNRTVITVTEVGSGTDCPEAVAAAEQMNRKNGKKKRSLVVVGNQFEKIGGRDSVRVVDGKKSLPISQFALEIGLPLETKLRSGGGGGRGGPVVARTLEEVEERKLNYIKDALIKAGYSARMTEKRLNSKRTFRGGHREGHPGMYDWYLILPGGVGVRSREEISRNPKTPEMDEDDVLFSDEEEEGGEGTATRAQCKLRQHCVCVQGHVGRCIIHPAFRKRGDRTKEKKEKASGEKKEKKVEDVPYSWEEIVKRQKIDREERLLKRQGQWGGSYGVGSDVNVNEEKHSVYSEGDGEDGSGDDCSGYGCTLGFSSSSEEEDCHVHEEEEMTMEAAATAEHPQEECTVEKNNHFLE